MTATDRSAERRRLLDAVRHDGEADTSRDTEAEDRSADRKEPAPDGGTVSLDGPLYVCLSCDRTYLERPAGCAGCGGSSFDRRSAE